VLGYDDTSVDELVGGMLPLGKRRSHRDLA
jgi:hypothetical protein